MLIIVVAILVFYLGASFGSFYNVLIDRLPLSRDVISSRSICESCNTKLNWIDLFPLFSFIALGRKCRYCGIKLSFQYFISELSVGSLFLLSFCLWGQNLEYGMMIYHIVFWSMLFCVAVIDYKTGYIMDQVLIVFTVSGLVVSFFLTDIAIVDSLLGGVVGFGCYGTLYGIVRLILKKEGFGSGDVMLLGAVGFFLGPTNTLITAVLSFYVSIPFILLKKVKCKRLGKHFEVPFGPAVCTTAFIISLFPTEIYQCILNMLGFK